jgi:phosphopantetheine--protein transferase-like protein
MVKMDKKEALRKAIAKILNENVNSITDIFSLDVSKLNSSAGSVILSNVVKKTYKQKIDCTGVKTFGELLSKIENTDARNGGANNNDAQKSEIEDVHQSVPSSYQAVPQSTPVSIGVGISCGIDIQDISIFPEAADYWSEHFYEDNFTGEEIAYCVSAPLPRLHFAARWCVKEALKKSSPIFLTLPFKSIQIKKEPDGNVSIEVFLNGEWQKVTGSCSMSSSGQFAVGMVIVYHTDFASDE